VKKIRGLLFPSLMGEIKDEVIREKVAAVWTYNYPLV